MEVGKCIHENPSDNDVGKHIHENPYPKQLTDNSDTIG